MARMRRRSTVWSRASWPQTGASNINSQLGGAWAEPEISGEFELRKKRSFTLEGWFEAPPVPELTFLVGTRSGEANDSQGWHVDLDLVFVAFEWFEKFGCRADFHPWTPWTSFVASCPGPAGLIP